MQEPDLSARQRELMTAFVAAWEASSHTPFDLDASKPFEHPSWPAGVAAPRREEVRPLLKLGLLDSDRSARTWRVYPSPDGRAFAGVAAEAALADPDARLELILHATASAFAADPSQPLQFHPMQQADLVRHPHWPLQPDVVRAHDLQQLEDLGLIATAAAGRSLTFWPTIGGRLAVSDAAGYLERLARDSDDDSEKSRLQLWAKKVRAGDVVVGTVTSTGGALIRALMGL